MSFYEINGKKVVKVEIKCSLIEVNRKFGNKFAELVKEFDKRTTTKKKRQSYHDDLHCAITSILFIRGRSFFRVFWWDNEKNEVYGALSGLLKDDMMKYIRFAVDCLSSQFDTLKYVISFHLFCIMVPHSCFKDSECPEIVDDLFQLIFTSGILDILFAYLHSPPSPTLYVCDSKVVFCPGKPFSIHAMTEDAHSRNAYTDTAQYGLSFALKRPFAWKALIGSKNLEQIVDACCDRFLKFKVDLLPSGYDCGDLQNFEKTRDSAGLLVQNFTEGRESQICAYRNISQRVLKRILAFVKTNERREKVMKEDSDYFKEVLVAIMSNCWYMNRTSEGEKYDESVFTVFFSLLRKDRPGKGGKVNFKFHLKILRVLCTIFFHSEASKKKFMKKYDPVVVLSNLLIYHHFPDIQPRELTVMLHQFAQCLIVQFREEGFFKGLFLEHVPGYVRLSQTRFCKVNNVPLNDGRNQALMKVLPAPVITGHIMKILTERYNNSSEKIIWPPNDNPKKTDLSSEEEAFTAKHFRSIPVGGVCSVTEMEQTTTLGGTILREALDKKNHNLEEKPSQFDNNLRIGGLVSGKEMHKHYFNRCRICGKIGAKNTCQKCRVPFYCSILCQKKDWKKHRVECGSLSKNIKGFRKKLKSQDTSGNKRPGANSLVVVLRECAVCGKFSKSRCSRCKITSYCSRKCQKKDWKIHKGFCRV